ncbi:oncostatin-M-specific receptor subunit beta [Protopterus annectens]|uniref:oncostatin-M-specific receptor subunit beta n=1 Tax=Protopterus annectens TaxID=7888 RepID=UPI001CF9D71A|nr:oncostatin-M-specific receptor subunit beta [Protopterus annectens]
MALIQIIQTMFTAALVGFKECQGYEFTTYPPQIVNMSTDSFLQQLFVEWNVSHLAYEAQVNMTFQIQLTRSENLELVVMKNYSKSLKKTDTVLRWVWESDLPLECTSHSIRIRSIVDDKKYLDAKIWSEWSEWKTIWGLDTANITEASVFPDEKIVKEGTNITFCCIIPKGARIQRMTYGQKIFPVIFKNNRTTAIKVHNVPIPKNGNSNLICTWTMNKTRTHDGTVLFVGNPPDVPRNLTCETQDLREMICSWHPGKATNLITEYSIFEQFSGKYSPCTESRESSSSYRCKWVINSTQENYNLTVKAKNYLGESESSIFVDVFHKVHPLQPSEFKVAAINATAVTVYWCLNANYSIIQLLCQTEIYMKNKTAKLHYSSLEGQLPSICYSTAVGNLHPYTNYSFRTRCATAKHFWKWSAWSEKESLVTDQMVPSMAPDTWIQIVEGNGGHNVKILWKTLPDSVANGRIDHYSIRWTTSQVGKSDSTVKYIPANTTNITVFISNEQCRIEVKARTSVGWSPPSVILIPHITENEVIEEGRVSATGDGLCLSWKHDPYVIDGYVVDWCNSPFSPGCDLQWKKIPSNATSVIIKSAKFKPGLRYRFGIYGFKIDGAHLLEKKVGYIKELAPEMSPSIHITETKPHIIVMNWTYPANDEMQPGFIKGYYVYVRRRHATCIQYSERNSFSDSTDCQKIKIEEPKQKSYVLRDLKPNTEYLLMVTAFTAGGESPGESTIQVGTTNDNEAVVYKVIFWVFGIAAVMVSLVTLGIWKKTWFKMTLCPDIPNPNKSMVLKLGSPLMKAHAESPTLKMSPCIINKLEVLRLIRDQVTLDAKLHKIISAEKSSSFMFPEEYQFEAKYQPFHYVSQMYPTCNSEQNLGFVTHLTASIIGTESFTDVLYPCNMSAWITSQNHLNMDFEINQYSEHIINHHQLCSIAQSDYASTKDNCFEHSSGYKPQVQIISSVCKEEIPSFSNTTHTEEPSDVKKIS